MDGRFNSLRNTRLPGLSEDRLDKLVWANPGSASCLAVLVVAEQKALQNQPSFGAAG